MINYEKNFKSSWGTASSETETVNGILLVCRPGGDVLTPFDSSQVFPEFPSDAVRSSKWPRMRIGFLDNKPLTLLPVPPDTPPWGAAAWRGLRDYLGHLDADRTEALSRASMLASWHHNNAFCGRCGIATELDESEPARVCPSCAHRAYPRLSPAMIVRITAGRRILLAHNRRFPDGVYSCIAGYVEPGENLEETVIREVREEVGLDAAPPRYLASQPWPFPHSLMLGFETTAKGEPVPDGLEITHAQWFDAEQLPRIPRPGTIARHLIDDWLNRLAQASDRSPLHV